MYNFNNPTQPVYGNLTLKNGIQIPWLRFVNATLSKELAAKEAIRIVIAQHGGSVAECTAN